MPTPSAAPDSVLPDGLAALRGLRTAPVLSGADRQRLRAELDRCLAACDWFTIGVMAASAEAALAALRAAEGALGWPALKAGPSPTEGEGGQIEARVFLKGNQNSGNYLLRQEAGLGSGLLISGHSPADPDAENTWGPLPLDFFS